MDLSDSESDFDAKADPSDLDSDSDEEYKASERRVARKTISGTRVISGGRKQLSVNRRSGSNPLSTVTTSEPEPVGICADHVEAKDDSTPGHTAGGVCCSCSPWSGCKTKKCSCKAVGGFCGPQCGCKVGRCANRSEIANSETPLFSVNEIAPGQTEMAAAMADLRVDSPRVSDQLSTPPISGSILSRGGAKYEGDQFIASPETERALVKKGVTLLDSAYKFGLYGSMSPDLGVESLEMQDGQRKDIEVGTKRPRRPLSDIGNNKVCPCVSGILHSNF